jgi:hypothetical protein
MAREIITGARCRFMLNGVKVGGATGVTIDENYTYEPQEELDNVEVAEYVVTGYTVGMRAQRTRIAKDDVVKAGWMPAKGADHETHLRNLLTSGALSAVVVDNKTNTPLETLTQVKLAGRTVNIVARGIVGTDLTFNAIRNLTEGDST